LSDTNYIRCAINMVLANIVSWQLKLVITRHDKTGVYEYHTGHTSAIPVINNKSNNNCLTEKMMGDENDAKYKRVMVNEWEIRVLVKATRINICY
jgi:hypothetical protein